MKICKRYFGEFEESEVDVVDVSPATELADYVDSRFHGNEGITGMTEGRQTLALRISMIFTSSAKNILV